MKHCIVINRLIGKVVVNQSLICSCMISLEISSLATRWIILLYFLSTLPKMAEDIPLFNFRLPFVSFDIKNKFWWIHWDCFNKLRFIVHLHQWKNESPIYRKMEPTLLNHGEWLEDKIDESHVNLTTLLKHGEWLQDKIDESHVRLATLLKHGHTWQNY